MYFCPKCKTLLVPSDGRIRCPSCNHSETTKIRIKDKDITPPKDVVVVDEANEHIGDDVIPIVCWNCGHTGVYFWMVQMRRADEPPTRFYKCRHCKKVWRSGK